MTVDATFDHFPILTTERLRLRRVEPGDAEDLLTIYGDEETMRYYGQPYQTLDEVRAYIPLREADYEARRAVRWGIAHRDDDRIIGTCGFHHFDEGYHRAETGYILNRAAWGQGIMAETLTAIFTFGFDEMGLHRIEAIIDIANERSKHVLLRLGFQYEGNLRQRYFLNGGFEDEHFFGLLRDEWHGRLP